MNEPTSGGPMTPVDAKVLALALAIQQQEGWKGGKGATTSFRNNNPGNIKFEKRLRRAGYLLSEALPHDDGNGFAVFPDYQAGLNAVCRQIGILFRRNPQYTLLDVAILWLGGTPPDVASVPAKEGKPISYAKGLASTIK